MSEPLFAARIGGAKTAFELHELAEQVARAGLPAEPVARLQALFAARCLWLWPRECRRRD